MAGKVTFFPVDNGDMTLIKLDDERKTTILVDMNIRQKADDENDDTRDVGKDLRDRLEKDDRGRHYVDVFAISHPDQDHCGGVRTHLHLAPMKDYDDEDDKIVVKELWSSPKVFRRAKKSSKDHKLCDDAQAIADEARRRVNAYKNFAHAKTIGDMPEGDRIRIIGEDDDGKTDKILEIVTKVDESFSEVNGKDTGLVNVRVLGPLPVGEAEENGEVLAKNRSSVIMRMALKPSTQRGECLFLTGGDAEVEVWDRLYDRHRSSSHEPLEYDLLQTPHHCSWGVLSHDSWSDKGADAKVSEKARDALSQLRDKGKGYIVSSSKPIKDDEDNPPNDRAKREYMDIVGSKNNFYCTGEHPSADEPKPLEFTITEWGFEPPKKKAPSANSTAAGLGATTTGIQHG